MAIVQRVNATDTRVFSGGNWQPPIVNPAPKAVFSAANESAVLGTSGYIRWTGNSKVSELIPNAGGERGFKFAHAAKDPWGDATAELRFTFLVPVGHYFEYVKFWQPPNFYHRYFAQVKLETDLAGITGWQVGDVISNGANSGILAAMREINDNGTTRAQIYIKDMTAAEHSWLPDGATLTNQATAGTAVINSAGFEPNNNKFSAQWINNYSNGGMLLEFFTDWNLNGNSKIKADVNTSLTYPNIGARSNQITGTGNILFDTADNDAAIELVTERSRNTTQTSNDGIYRIWKKQNRVGAPYESWTLIFENTNCRVWNDGVDEAWTHGYCMGAANSGYDEQTDWYLQDWQMWVQKPPFLP